MECSPCVRGSCFIPSTFAYMKEGWCELFVLETPSISSTPSGLVFLSLPASSSPSLPPFLFLFFHSVNGKAWEALWVAHRFLEYFLSTVTLNWFKFTWHTQCMIFFKELHNLLRNLCIFLFCYLNYMPFQRCLITSVAGLKRTKTFLMKQWWLYFRSHPTDSWQTFLKITSVPTLVSQTIFLNFSALEWSPRLPQRL